MSFHASWRGGSRAAAADASPSIARAAPAVPAALALASALDLGAASAAATDDDEEGGEWAELLLLLPVGASTVEGGAAPDASAWVGGRCT